MRRVLTLLLVAIGLTSVLAGEEPRLPTVPTLNWNANPGGFPRSPRWVRTEAGYYFATLGPAPVSLVDVLRDARTTGTSTVVLGNWQAPRKPGFRPVDLKGAIWNVTAGTSLERFEERPADDTAPPEPIARFSWKAGGAPGEYLQVDLSSGGRVDLNDRPLVMLQVRSSRPGRFMRLRLLDLDGRTWMTPIDIREAGAWVRVGPFAPGLTAADDAIETVRALRFERTADTSGVEGDVTVEIAAVLATAPVEELSDLFLARSDLGGGRRLADVVHECRRLGGRVILDVDAGHMPGDCRFLTGGRLRKWVARAGDGSPVFTVDEEGRCRFKVRPTGGWIDVLAAGLAEKLIRGCDVDGVYVTGLDAVSSPEDADGTSTLLGRLRLTVGAERHDGVLFAEHATATALKQADVTCGPTVHELKGFLYASAGTVADVPVRGVTDVDALHRVIALGLKTTNDVNDLDRTLSVKPGSAASAWRTVSASRAAPPPSTLGRYKARLAAARRGCARFFDHWKGARWRGRILTGNPACEIYHFSVGREHLFNVVNVADTPVGPITLDVSNVCAHAFVDAVTGDIFPIEGGELSLTVEPHGFVMLHTALTTAVRERVPSPASGARVLSRADE